MDHWLQELVWRRAGHRCEYCQMPQSCDPIPFEIDHIIAESHDGKTVASNLCVDPRRHKWARHFRWDGPFLIGRSPQGRATVRVLRINLDYRVGFRQELIDEGVFPLE